MTAKTSTFHIIIQMMRLLFSIMHFCKSVYLETWVDSWWKRMPGNAERLNWKPQCHNTGDTDLVFPKLPLGMTVHSCTV